MPNQHTAQSSNTSKKNLNQTNKPKTQTKTTQQNDPLPIFSELSMSSSCTLKYWDGALFFSIIIFAQHM